MFKGLQLPQSGSFNIDTINDFKIITLSKGGHNYYRITSGAYLQASLYKYVVKYEVPAIWFRQWDGADSFLFSGTFYSPRVKEKE